ncbi:hypothetical protein [Burkholderia pseudomallei]|uniref:hypothetical protein n=1 Tax=Burkholderia pseudomallei TaxID=28450 RepID=UPI00047FB32A|nr:hypothetical protein [Burkholderia pseudomallei]APD38676.1 hypothetical protein BK015_26470 [Burkholderia pseudomallei]ARK43254.1 hypothetical protein BOC60_23800 [Burkholderia pseudomallei]ARL06657.1 hypothetical protein BOC44_35295 [Burkholderia pseudomallei]ARL11789.1 hypothetical protein BOC45_23985 [Burkholderia pseudomallei]ARL56209.1 hypothetical protein BOC52_06035 [Burkholderia pseudomallei]
MKMKTNRLMAPLLATCLMLATVAHAQTPPPLQDVNPNRHPNIAAAQASIRQAYDAISAAQGANHDRLGGHAERAKRLLDEASAELKAAALTANANGQ